MSMFEYAFMSIYSPAMACVDHRTTYRSWFSLSTVASTWEDMKAGIGTPVDIHNMHTHMSTHLNAHTYSYMPHSYADTRHTCSYNTLTNMHEHTWMHRNTHIYTHTNTCTNRHIQEVIYILLAFYKSEHDILQQLPHAF